ncbi:MAG: hypothetical protein ACRD43_03215 [Pyrinomonadaceae bacterium]
MIEFAKDRELMSITDNSPDTVTSEKSKNESPGELHQPIWSVISFDRHEAVGLCYREAFQKLTELETDGVTGLCIVTDEAAARVGKN